MPAHSHCAAYFINSRPKWCHNVIIQWTYIVVGWLRINIYQYSCINYFLQMKIQVQLTTAIMACSNFIVANTVERFLCVSFRIIFENVQWNHSLYLWHLYWMVNESEKIAWICINFQLMRFFTIKWNAVFALWSHVMCVLCATSFVAWYISMTKRWFTVIDWYKWLLVFPASTHSHSHIFSGIKH